MRIAIVVHAVKIPVLIRRIKHGDDESRLNLRADRLLQPQGRKPAMNRLRHPRMARRLRRLALGEVFGKRLLCRINRLHGRRELHLSRLFKVGVLLVEIAVIRAHGIILRRFDERGAADDKGKPRHRLYTLLRRCHAEVNVRLFHRKGQHRIRRSRIDDERRAVRMRERTDLADGV